LKPGVAIIVFDITTMSDTTRRFFALIALIVVGFFAIQWVIGIATLVLFKVLVPAALILGIGYVAVKVLAPKALGRGRRTLP
jgi:hypothetical protein